MIFLVANGVANGVANFFDFQKSSERGGKGMVAKFFAYIMCRIG
jgi:hypothetical protein